MSLNAGEGVGLRGLSANDYRAQIFKLLRSPRIGSKEPIPPGCECVACMAGRYDKPYSYTRFLAPIDCLKIPAQLYTGAQINFGDLTLYLTYASYKEVSAVSNLSIILIFQQQQQKLFAK
jgi:hypothetical protein